MERVRYNTELLFMEYNTNLSNFWGAVHFFVQKCPRRIKT
ncbi:MAG: hypothetical protein EZS26_003437 [Candidatus Ordinivivax streblomastigis]|uniref:Uncharacterized protein n=1 Tax=Candidatus Ordinivivax streblomastigis TaxID=2540710 RepID=A0A5M8NU44_9BACT|nr:MAG: hypothetical protein EZS26_003437 [Candidatus Ordinivivax streblomastigis]